jgi:hypothetical protein
MLIDDMEKEQHKDKWQMLEEIQRLKAVTRGSKRPNPFRFVCFQFFLSCSRSSYLFEFLAKLEGYVLCEMCLLMNKAHGNCTVLFVCVFCVRLHVVWAKDATVKMN